MVAQVRILGPPETHPKGGGFLVVAGTHTHHHPGYTLPATVPGTTRTQAAGGPWLGLPWQGQPWLACLG